MLYALRVPELADLLAVMALRRAPAEARPPALAEFSALARRFGAAPVQPDDDERAQLAALGVTWPVARTVDELARVAVLLGAPAETLEELARAGDNREQAAVLRALPLRPDAPRFLRLAVNAGRSNVVPVFCALACENPYPAEHFPPAEFRALALKTVTLGAGAGRVLGLARRRDAELGRMARDCASERRAAGRPVPEDLALLLPEVPP